MGYSQSREKKIKKIIHRYTYSKDSIIVKNDTVIYRRKWWVPNNLKLQYAGNIGFMAVGAGYKLSSWYDLSIMYGYLGNQSQVKDVHTVALKNTFALSKKIRNLNFIPTAGISINWGYTHNTFSELPDYYPNGYYFQNKIHFAPFLGGIFSLKDTNLLIKKFDVYFEFSILDAYLLEMIRRDYVKFNDVVNLAIGVSWHLN